MKLAKFVLAAFALAAVATAGQASRAADLIVATDTAFVPFEFKQGDKYVGFDLDMWDAIAKEIVSTYKLPPLDFHGTIPALQPTSLAARRVGKACVMQCISRWST